VDRDTDEIAVCVGTDKGNRRFELGDVQRLRDLERRHTEAEYARLLYVATTRARDHFVVSLYHKKGASSSGARRLMDHEADQLADRRPELPGVARAVTSPFPDLDVDPANEVAQGEFEDERGRLVTSATTRLYTSATALGHDKKEEKDDESEPWSRGRGGTRLGRAVHAAIQSLPLDADAAMIEAFSRAQAVAEAIPHRAADVLRLVDWVLRSSQAIARARAAARCLREVPFAVTVDGTVLEGFIDLVIDSGDGMEIIDWKTDQIGSADVAERLREYETQAGLYVYGLEAATGRRVSAVTYVFAGAGVEVSPGDPAALSEAARRALTRTPTA
jgi:ATP-dependent helicase/nuclease subunit A